MTYEQVWKEQVAWLENSIVFMEEREQDTEGKEKDRIKAKLEGLKISYHRMKETEYLYKPQ